MPTLAERTAFLANVRWHFSRTEQTDEQDAGVSALVDQILWGYARHFGIMLLSQPVTAPAPPRMCVDDAVHAACFRELCKMVVGWLHDGQRLRGAEPGALVALVDRVLWPYAHKHGLCGAAVPATAAPAGSGAEVSALAAALGGLFV